MSRSEVFRFRLEPDEQERLTREAAERGLSKADLIRTALGWEPRSALPPSKAAESLVAGASAEPTADPTSEPGKSAIEELAKRISGGEGLPMRAARNKAKDQLTQGA